MHSHVVNLLRQTAITFIRKRLRPIDTEPPKAKIAAADFAATGASETVVHGKDDGRRYSTRSNVELTKNYLVQLRNDVEASGGRFVIFYIPSSADTRRYRATQEHAVDEKTVKTVVENEDIRVFSLTPVLTGSGVSMNQLYFVEGHLMPVAHSLVAAFMISSLFEDSK